MTLGSGRERRGVHVHVDELLLIRLHNICTHLSQWLLLVLCRYVHVHSNIMEKSLQFNSIYVSQLVIGEKTYHNTIVTVCCLYVGILHT